MPATAFLEKPASAQPDLSAVKQRQQGAWSSGDYAMVGTTLQIVGEQLEEQGGVVALEARNREKAALIYQELDEHPDVYEPAVTDRADRSLMNITFRLRNPDEVLEFLERVDAEIHQKCKSVKRES